MREHKKILWTVPSHHNADPRITLQHSQFSSQHNVSRPGLTSFGSTPHIPQQQQPFYNYEQQQAPYQQQQAQYQPAQYQYRDIEEYGRGQFYLHDAAPPPRRTWAQHAQHQQHEHELRGWQVGAATLHSLPPLPCSIYKACTSYT